MAPAITRRDFLRASAAGAAVFSTAAVVPDWLTRSAEAIPDNSGQNRILVVIQMEGGNDGINTVIPYTDPVYTSSGARNALLISSGYHVIDGQNALNPALPDLATWYGSNNLSIVQNVGYPNPDLSHFISTDYWTQGRIPGGPAVGTLGWLGRTFDETCAGNPAIDPLTMAGIGHSRVPEAMRAGTFTAPAIRDINSYEIKGSTTEGSMISDRRLSDIHALHDVATADPLVDFIQAAENVAEASIDVIQGITYVPPVTYPNTKLGRDLELVSKILHTAGTTPRVLHVHQGGYDTHAAQTTDHPALLGTLNDALNAFLLDLQMSGELDRVLVLTFSEFGRRVAENDSNGTDHGAASMLFLAGGGAKGGIYGGQPDLVNLQKGNLQHVFDFRNVYADVLRFWFEINPDNVFQQSWSPIGFLQPVNLGEAWVDFAYNGIETGTQAQPFKTLSAAVAAVAVGGTVKVKAGMSGETITINKNVRIEAVGGSATVG